MTVACLIDPVAREAAAWLRATVAPQARLVADSRRVGAGDVFVAWPGAARDGRRFIAAAAAAGAAAVLAESATAATTAPDATQATDATDATQAQDPAGGAPSRSVPLHAVPGLRERAGPIAAAWLGEPSAAIDVVAVTGTNGKTSTTHWVAAGCNARAGRDSAAVVGTLGSGVPGRLDATGLTTPDALDLQWLFRRFADAGLRTVAIEASSIGLVQGRLNGTRIGVAVMTNLTRDHLDVHGTMQAYGEAKALLFRWPGLKAAVLNLDDPAAAAMRHLTAAPVRRIGYRVDADRAATAAAPTAIAGIDCLVCAAEPDLAGRTELRIGDERAPLRLALIGRFNLANALAVAGVWKALGWSLADIVTGLQGLRPVPGRVQLVGAPDALERPLVVVDYAHTPDAIANVLVALRPIAQRRGGRLWCVFGAGGDRDPGKRAPMAAAACAGADDVVLTSDNPRSEDPARILSQLTAGLTRPARLVEPDRARAIAAAVAAAAAGDVVLVAGKGHEDYQEIAGRRQPFSDVAQAVQARAAWTPTASGDVDG